VPITVRPYEPFDNETTVIEYAIISIMIIIVPLGIHNEDEWEGEISSACINLDSRQI